MIPLTFFEAGMTSDVEKTIIVDKKVWRRQESLFRLVGNNLTHYKAVVGIDTCK